MLKPRSFELKCHTGSIWDCRNCQFINSYNPLQSIFHNLYVVIPEDVMQRSVDRNSGNCLAWRIGFWPRWERGWGRSWPRSINKSRGETQSSRSPALGSGPTQCQCGARTEWQRGMGPGSSSRGGQSPSGRMEGPVCMVPPWLAHSLCRRAGQVCSWGHERHLQRLPATAGGGDNTLKLCRWELRATRIWILMLIQPHLYAQLSLNNIWSKKKNSGNASHITSLELYFPNQ